MCVCVCARGNGGGGVTYTVTLELLAAHLHVNHHMGSCTIIQWSGLKRLFAHMFPAH